MGLDMYAYRVKQEHAIGDFEIAKDEIRYEQIWQMKKAIKIWNLLKDELA